jgi:two-component system sensor histidine kinase KdpD
VTGVVVRETILIAIDEASEIEVIDLPPDELLVRLSEGKYMCLIRRHARLKSFSQRESHSTGEMSLRRRRTRG